MEKYMMGTIAIHKMGDISREDPDLCFISDEDEENYVGHWVTGYGFVNVKFPKSTTRELSKEEIKHYNNLKFQLSHYEPWQLKVD
jgi:hypothetical protein